MKKIEIHRFFAFLTGITIVALSITQSVKVNAENQEQTPSLGTTTPKLTSMGMIVQVDKPFIELMVPHHEALVDMSNMALIQAKNPEVKKLAEKMIKDQTRDINNMKTWYKQWYGTEVPTSGMNMGRQNAIPGKNMEIAIKQQGMMMNSMMEDIKKTSSFDQAYLRQMIPHHQMGIVMSEFAFASGEHPEIRKLGESDLKSQNEEINQMQKLLSQMP